MIVKSAAKCRYCDEVFDPALERRSNRRQSSDDDVNAFPTADLGKRFVGFLADLLGFAAFLVPGIALLIVGVATAGNRNGEPPTVAIIGFLLIPVGLIAYCVVSIYLLITRSQSIGKYFVGTQIMDYESDLPADFVKCFLLRVLVNGMLGIVPFYGLVDILYIFGDEHRCLHDQIAGTYVADIS
jgi:uncharacterized RDD family membrane protein YckC